MVTDNPISLKDLQAEFPGWRIWQSTSDQQYYATRKEGGIRGRRGETTTKLRTEIRDAEHKVASGVREAWWTR